MTAWSELRGESIWWDEGRRQWRYPNGDAVTDFTKSRAPYWDIQWMGNPWLSLGVHVDHQRPFVILHLPGVMIGVGNLGYPGLGHGVRSWRR